MKFLWSLAAMLVLSNCGTTDTSEKPVTASNKVVLEAEAMKPKFLVVRVPVGADGQELVDGAQAREVMDKNAQITNAADANAAFEKSTVVQVKDELDQTSSTESYGRYWYWNTPWYAGKALGRGLWWGRNPYVSYSGYTYSYTAYYNSYSYGCNAGYGSGCYNYYYWY